MQEVLRHGPDDLDDEAGLTKSDFKKGHRANKKGALLKR